ncbi:uncharacterized protein [Venturia canescens]|nr:uncharacterized protein LOC122416167 isoform X2 [Venturia canescens]XP_043284824.1 uncharacterized protein LOC122416167 isoform X2 [Venturia canescens]
MDSNKTNSSATQATSGPPTPLAMPSTPIKRLRLDDSEYNECEKTESLERSIDSNSAMSDGDGDGTLKQVESPERPMSCEEISMAFLKNKEYVKSYNDLKNFVGRPDSLVCVNCPFVIKPHGWTEETFSEEFQKMMEHSYADFGKFSTSSRNMYEAPWNAKSNDRYYRQRNQIVEKSFTYTDDQIKTYLEMKVILESDNFHVCVLTGDSGTGKTVFLKQFFDDPEIDVIYIASQHSLLGEACRTLHLDSTTDTMTLASLMMKIFCFEFDEYKKFIERLIKIPIEEIEGIGSLPDNFKLNGNALNDLFARKIFYSTPSRKLVLCIDEFNMINTAELCIMKLGLERLVSAKKEVNLILLLCGNPFRTQPIFVPALTADEEKTNESFAADGSDAQRPMSENAASAIKLGQTRFEFKHELKHSNNVEYQTFLHNLKNSNKLEADVFEFFHAVSEVRIIPHKYCIPALLDLPTPNRSNPFDEPDDRYLCDVTAWVQTYGKDFNGSSCYSYLNAEAHRMNLSIAFSAWQQCRLFNEAANQRGNPTIPLHQIPRLVPVYPGNESGRLTGKSEVSELPLVIGFRYKVLHSDGDLKNGDTVTLVHVQYENEASCKKVCHLLVVTTDGDVFKINPGLYSVPSFLGHSKRDELFGFPLRLAFAKTIRGSIGPPIEGDVYSNVTNCSAEEVYTLLTKIRDCSQVKGLAWVK